MTWRISQVVNTSKYDMVRLSFVRYKFIVRPSASRALVSADPESNPKILTDKTPPVYASVETVPDKDNNGKLCR
ncbi:jg27291 [Pararge aegeria aegeria]|uniref:Jg27291 protein n=1 Tax=Pararge aegeria aegeria TaxID=348720 RepID=A0A8S4SJL3_9NEOP|nr:jg27291 [Pararge aegeria aegeria]